MWKLWWCTIRFFFLFIAPKHFIDSKCSTQKNRMILPAKISFFGFFKCAININGLYRNIIIYEHDRFSICNKSCKKHKLVNELGICVKITVATVCHLSKLVWMCLFSYIMYWSTVFLFKKKRIRRKIEVCLFDFVRVLFLLPFYLYPVCFLTTCMAWGGLIFYQFVTFSITCC